MGKRAFGVAGLAVLIALAAAAARSCSRRSSDEDMDRELGQSPEALVEHGPALVHATGLVLGQQPPAYTIHETETGFRIEPSNARRLRNPWSVQIQLVEEAPPKDLALQLKKLGARTAHYRASISEDVGSGGPLHTLTAWTACATHRVVMTATQQAEPPAKPDWSAAWAILAAARCEP